MITQETIILDKSKGGMQPESCGEERVIQSLWRLITRSFRIVTEESSRGGNVREWAQIMVKIEDLKSFIIKFFPDKKEELH